MIKDHAGMIAVMMWGIDIVMPALACVLAYLIYPNFNPVPEAYYQAMLACTLMSSLAFPHLSLNRGWRGDSIGSEIQAVSIAVLVVFLALAILGVATNTAHEYSRVWFLIWVFLTWAGLTTYRALLRLFLRWLRSHGFNQRHIVLIGEGQALQNVIATISSTPWIGYQISGIFCDDESTALPVGYSITGSTSEAAAFSHDKGVDQIWLAMALKQEEKLSKLLYLLRHTTADVRYVPDIFGFRLFNHSVSTVAGLPVINLSTSPMDGFNRFIKAVEDKVLASLIIFLIAPLMVLIAIGVKLTSRGPVFYRQSRVGWNGSEINLIKFRSMPVDAEGQSGPIWASSDDGRATAFGAFLRKTSLDELPQFFNVLMGDMSIVGPRPERPVFVEKFKEEIPDYMKKHVVKAGITGWAQVNGWRGNTDLHKRIEHDLYYIKNWSLFFDLKIIVLTIFHGFKHKNAY